MSEWFNACTYLLDRHVEAGDGGRTAVTGPRGSHTYAELLGLIEGAAAGLVSLGVRPEERVMIFMADSPRMLATILGAMRLGAVAVPVSTMLTGRELAGLLTDSRARTLVASAEFAPVVGQAVAGSPVDVIILDGEAELEAPGDTAVHGYDVLLGDGASGYEVPGPVPYQTLADSAALWLYTSGTTGAPKAAIHRHANIRHVAETYGSQVLGITRDDVCYSVAKLFFAYGIGNSLFFPFSVGARAVLDPDRPTPGGVAARLVEERPTLFYGVPTFYAALLASDVPRGAFSSVRFAVSAGEPLPAEIYRRFLDRFGVHILDGIGSTEALHIFLSNRPDDVRPGTTGKPVPGYELRLADDAGGDVAAGEPGHLFVRGASIALGYWCRTDATRQVFRGEWLRTGDTYVRTPDGYYACLGRSNDMIKAGGIWVSPTEVEARLLEHPGVAQAAVVGLLDAEGLEKPVACVVRAAGAAGDTVEEEELVEFCRAGLASFKRPREVLFFDDLPRTATGKLQRFAVRAAALDRRESAPAEPEAPTPA
ncbi:MAG: benzoate-CoA ligase family protein [Carbonactinosporaceae bacterium]